MNAPISIAPNSERTLLLVDDEVNVLNALARLLRPDGYRLLRAESGEAALEVLATHKVGVIISDQRMPGMSGVEFLRHAKQLYPDSVRIVLSGYTELKSVTDAINEGSVYKFLTKPWDDEQLRANIRAAFYHFELAAENVRLTSELAAANKRLSLSKGKLEIEVQHGIGVLQILQEMFELVPIGLLGVDQEGVIVAANRKADELLGIGPNGSLLGAMVAERLPVAIVESFARIVRGDTTESARWLSPQGEEFEFWCHVMGAASRSRGVAIAILPAGRSLI